MSDDLTPEQRETFQREMKVNQLLIACLTIVGNADSILQGRVDLCAFVETLTEEEMGLLFCAAIETVALKIALETSTPEEFNLVLQNVGAIMAQMIEGTE